LGEERRKVKQNEDLVVRLEEGSFKPVNVGVQRLGAGAPIYLIYANLFFI